MGAQPSERQQQMMMQAIEAMQVRDSLRMYNQLVEKCFNDCVESFRRKNLDSAEEKCIHSCCEKFMKHSARVSVRFQALTAEQEAQMQQQAGK